MTAEEFSAQDTASEKPALNVLSDADLTRAILTTNLATVLLPPFIGGTILMILGFWPFPEFYSIFISYTGIYVAIAVAFAVWAARGQSQHIQSLAKEPHGEACEKATRLMRRFPWALVGLLILYCVGGVYSANISLEHNGYSPPYDLRGHLINQFGVIIAVLVTAIPIYYYFADRVGQYLAPRGIVISGAPLKDKIVLLGLGTPVLIDTMLIAYYYLNFGIAEINLIFVWLILIVLAGFSTLLVWVSVRQGLLPLQMGGALQEGGRKLPDLKDLKAVSLDELGLLTESMAGVIGRYRELQQSLEQRVRERTSELIRSKQQAESYLQIANTIIVSLDHKGIITLINKKGCDLLGREESELLGQDWFESCLPSDQREEIRFVFDKIMSGQVQAVESFENDILTEDGRRLQILWHNALIRDSSNTITGTLSAGLDITERKMTEDRLRHTQKMESLGNLAGGVAHSLNNLLVPIVALSRMVADNLPQGTPNRASMNKVVEAGLRASVLVRQILAFSRQDRPEKTESDLREVVTGTLRLARLSIPTNIEINEDITDEPIFLQLDRVQIEAAILNILNNAVAALDGGGNGQADRRISVGLAVCSSKNRYKKAWDKFGDGSCAVLSIQDTGCGMGTETMKRIFDPFFTTKKVGEGTGLGLSVSHGIVDEHGGLIDVESEIGKGSTFRIFLPIQVAGQTRARSKKEMDRKETAS